MRDRWDVVVIGGGGAGLSAALVLGRARRRTLLIDAGEQSNLPAAGVGGLLGGDGRPPAELYAAGRAEIAAYPSVELRTGETARRAGADRDGFTVELGDGAALRARKLLLAPGMEYRAPQLPGLRERWGGAVFHCPFCHGWELREGRLGVLGAGDSGVQRALLLRAWSERVALLTDGDSLGAAPRSQLEAAGVEVEPRPLVRLRGRGASLAAAVFEDGSERRLDGLLVGVSLHQRSDLPAQLGLALAEGPMSEEAIAVDPSFRTSVPGVFAAGDACAQLPAVAVAIASGSTAAAMLVHELTAELGPGRRLRSTR